MMTTTHTHHLDRSVPSSLLSVRFGIFILFLVGYVVSVPRFSADASLTATEPITDAYQHVYGGVDISNNDKNLFDEIHNYFDQPGGNAEGPGGRDSTARSSWSVGGPYFNDTSHFNVPMRDNVTLYTTLVRPPLSQPIEQHANVLSRTPYGTFNVQYWLEDLLFVGRDYNMVVQDFRGRFGSEGEYQVFRTDASDGYTTIEWLGGEYGDVSHWSSGEVFIYGLSADGIAGWLALQEQPAPFVRGVCGVFATGDLYPVIYPGGSLRVSLIYSWLNMLDEKEVIGRLLLQHEADDVFWKSTRLSQTAMQAIDFPTVSVAGWWDIFSQGTLDTWMSIRANNASVRNTTFLVVWPISVHCLQGGGNYTYYNASLSIGGLTDQCYDLFDSQRDSSSSSSPSSVLSAYPPLLFYVMGPLHYHGPSQGNYWVAADEFPAVTSTAFYFPELSSNNSINSAPTITSTLDGGESSFAFDPNNPIPTIGGTNYLDNCGPYDQQELETTRNDLVLFTSDVLAAPVALTGRIRATLFVSSNATDTDFTVKLTDVYPDGTSMLVQDGVQRMRWRDNTTATPTPMVPGVVYNISVDLWSSSFIFPVGHRMRVAVSSSNYPRYSINTNTGDLLNQTSTHNVTALNTVYHNATYPSHIVLPIVSMSDLPPAPEELWPGKRVPAPP
eukprot:TRINITY_DN13216_c0_g1_i1.p1 TRINITY_DN13216_c0_g1~~TRINITY_DN13216_c0_g1_i1.p1  ORF type:complete len:668 (-),score=118.71 TRINITY_DN13216_c0_g1_i1:42-2045(-)